MQNARDNHTASLLPDGKVLVVGGAANGGALPYTELYDPVLGTWNFAAALNVPRQNHSATWLPNGKLLVTGGATGDSITNGCELYDPVSGNWLLTGSMNIPRQYHTATLLPNGLVLVTAGHNSSSSYLSTCELYDPASGQWTSTVSVSPPRQYHTATLLPTGTVLLTGGFNGSTLRICDVFNVSLGVDPSWQPLINTGPSLPSGTSATFSGSRLRGVSGASGGNSSQNSATDYPLVQLRSIESGQTSFLKALSFTTNSFVSAPVNLPVGYALATAFVNGIPGPSAILCVDVPPVIIRDPVRLQSGAFRFVFTNSPGVTFTGVAVDGVTGLQSQFPLGVTETSPGLYQCTDPGASALSQRYYRVLSMQRSGPVGF